MMLLHTVSSSWDIQQITTFEWKVFNIYDSLARFCVPVFFMLSGAFLLNPDRKYTIKKLFTKNILRVIVAFIFWSASYAFIEAILLFKAIDSVMMADFLKRFISGHYHLWFLFVLVGLYIIVPFLRKTAESKQIMQYFIILSFVFSSAIPILATNQFFAQNIYTIVNRMNISFVIGYQGFFVLGYYLYKYELKSKTKFLIYVLGIISLLITIVGTYYLSIKTNTLDQTLYNYLAPNVYFMASSIFIYFKGNIPKIKLLEKYKHYIFMFSKFSFGMYLIHDFINILFARYLGFTILSFNPIFSVPIITILVFIISFMVTYFISKIPILNKYII